jgi:hypothetical protein
MRRTLLAVICFGLLLGACDKDFTRPEPDALKLGEVTRPEIVKNYGNPYSERTTVVGAPAARTIAADGGPVAGTFATLNYIYTDPMSKFLNTFRRKQIVFEFFNDRLYAYNFVSDVAEDETNFDESNVRELENGRTTREQATSLLGLPSGRAVFPAVPAGVEKLIYQYVTGIGEHRESKRLELMFERAVLKNFSFVTQSGTPQPPQSGGARTVPVIIPTR